MLGLHIDSVNDVRSMLNKGFSYTIVSSHGDSYLVLSAHKTYAEAASKANENVEIFNLFEIFGRHLLVSAKDFQNK